MKNIEDYLPYYIGCDCLTNIANEVWVLHTVHMKLPVRPVPTLQRKGTDVSIRMYVEEFKLLLRPLSDMTEEECMVITGYHKFTGQRELMKFKKEEHLAILEYRWRDALFGNGDGYAYSSSAVYFNKKEWTPELFTYLLKHSFDLFSLIESNLAIDATKINSGSIK